jgi:DnaJ domain
VSALYIMVLGLSALLAGQLLYSAYRTASPATARRAVRLGAGGIALAGAAVFAARGMGVIALPLAALGAWLMFDPNALAGSFPGENQMPPGQTSRIVTDTLEMELDLDTGAMRGRVLKGVFAGRPIERLAPAELAILWRDCRYGDPASAKLIEAYLDRAHPSWREDMARAESEPGAGGIMTREVALEILGLKAGASEDDIRRAHRDLMKKLHPDHGGSGYLAAKINEAKEVLIER